MKYPKLLAFICAIAVHGTNADQPQTDDLKPYPAAEAGFTRMVFRLPTLPDETKHKVEILIGKTLPVDCNVTRFSGDLEHHVAQGWGFPFYLLPKAMGPIATRMACPPDEPLHDEFVLVLGDGYLLPYNSKLPVVTYAPEGFSVRYRIWNAAEETGSANPE